MSINRYYVVFPPQNRQLFDGGKNNKFERSIIADNESPDTLNAVFTNGAVETRGGSTKFNTTSVGNFVGDGLYTRRDVTTAETMCAFWNGSMYTLGGTSTFTTVPSAQSVWTAGTRIGAAQYENHLFLGNGAAIPYKYNGSAFTRHGVYPPTTTATVASNGAGNLAGDYRYKVTYVNSQAAEGNPGPASVTFAVTATGGQTTVSNIPVAPQSFGVASRRLYRTDAGGSVFKRIVEIADNTTTTYNDNIASSSAGVSAPTDNGVPPIYSTVVYHRDRLFANDPANLNFIFYSGIGEPYTWGALDFERAGDATTDLVKAFAVYEGNLMVLCENSEFIIYMPTNDPVDWQVVRVRSAYGCKSPFAPVSYEDKILFPAFQNTKFVGFAAVAGAQIAPSVALLTVSAAGSELQSDRIEPDMFNVVPAFAGNISGMVYKNKAYIALTYLSGSTTNNRIYVYDFSISNLSKNQKEAWSVYTGINAAQMAIYNGNLYFISSTANGTVYQMETSTYNDDGAAINSYFWTKEFSGQKGHENLMKDFRKVKLLVDKPGAYFMNLTYRVDSDKGQGTTVLIDLNPGSSLWGTMMWGRDLWGGGQDQQEITLSLDQARGKRLQLQFSNQNTLNQKFKVHGMNFTYNIRGLR